MTNRLSISDLGYRYGDRVALDGVSFSVAEGRFCALLGPNGAGKSTLFALLTRLFVPHSGRIEIAGIDLARAPRAALARLGVVFQQPTLDLDLTVRRNLLYFAALHGLSGRASALRVDAALDLLGVRDRAGDRARDLSGGQRRRVEIARALVHEPRLLLLDEPTVGLDAASRRSITDHVHDLAAGGLTVLWATHLVDEIRPGDDVVILHRGRVLAAAQAAAIAGAGTLLARFLELTGEGTA
ncbi:ATP-binding cassette domain-containing protein [Limibaculum sp. FT325]|uniref:ATP-binding cassette domain-containing protein n=1 Tax=Thermohalobaculum sediminis TaxID=2939436 RepID=UPI0020BE03F9|nr:ATP-binding cassette domain-containing protein [Limibaculum sediminis]MCL5776891.1 ATP-binding cassette domain-containing protein [Limibaculum sediminis]